MYERGYGAPKSDLQRVMQHYNVDQATAESIIAECGGGSVEGILPARGTRLRTASLENGSNVWVYVGLGLLGLGLIAAIWKLSK